MLNLDTIRKKKKRRIIQCSRQVPDRGERSQSLRNPETLERTSAETVYTCPVNLDNTELVQQYQKDDVLRRFSNAKRIWSILKLSKNTRRRSAEKIYKCPINLVNTEVVEKIPERRSAEKIYNSPINLVNIEV